MPNVHNGTTLFFYLCVEQYDQSINDLTDCLTIQQSLLSANDRRMAETRYQLGLVCTFDKRYEAAVGHYRAAIAVIEAKMKQLAQVIAGEIPPSADVDPHGFDTPQQLAQKEMDELAGIVPDILAKVCRQLIQLTLSVLSDVYVRQCTIWADVHICPGIAGSSGLIIQGWIVSGAENNKNG